MNTSLTEVQQALKEFEKKLGTNEVAYMNADGIMQLEYGDLVIKMGSKTALPAE